MNNLSLVKISLGVAFATVATFIADANEVSTSISDAKAVVITTEKNTATEVEASSFQQKAFSKLLVKFDTDKNDVLSEEELATSDNTALKVAFKNLDVNEDGNLSRNEFSVF